MKTNNKKGCCVIPLLIGLLFTSMVATTVVAVSQPTIEKKQSNGWCKEDSGSKFRCKITRTNRR